MMNQYELLIPILAILVGGTIVIIPLLGLTARFALRPLAESWGLLRDAPVADERMQRMERRISLLEEQVQVLERENARILEDADFRRRLDAPRPAVETA